MDLGLLCASEAGTGSVSREARSFLRKGAARLLFGTGGRVKRAACPRHLDFGSLRSE
jgi:hypothetical protein